MGKRIAFTIVGAGIGGILGLLLSFLGLGTPAIVAGGVLGAVVPLLLGPPGK